MTPADFLRLRVGDLVVSDQRADTYIITSIRGHTATAVRTVDITSPYAWHRVYHADPREEAKPC